MPLIEVHADVLLHTDTGLRVIHEPGVKVTVYTPGTPDPAVFRAPHFTPAVVWAAIREHAVPLPAVATSAGGDLAERLLRDLLAAIHGDGGHHADDHGLVESTRRAMERVQEERGETVGPVS